MVRRVVSPVRSASRRGRTSHRLILGPLAAAALVLAACGSDDGGSPTTSTTDAAATAEQSAAGSAGATEPAPTADGKVAAADSMMAWQPVEYVYDGELPTLDGPAQAWRWTPGRTPTPDEIGTVAAALGVGGDVVEQPADMGGGWAVGAEGEHRLTVSTDAQGSWSYMGDVAPLCMDDVASSSSASSDGDAGVEVETRPAAAADEPATDQAPADDPATVTPPDSVACAAPVGIPTADEARTMAIELLQGLGLNPDAYQITADSQEWGAWADARLLVDGIATPALHSVGFGAEGALTFASGQLFAPAAAEQYVRTGTAAALEFLKADQFRSYSPEVDPAVTEVAPLPSPAPAEPDTPVSATDGQLASDPVEPTEPIEPVTVVLTGVEPGWWMVWDDDGTIWLLPGYDFLTEHGERISAPAVAEADLPIVDTKPGTEPQPGAGEAPAEPDIAPPLDD